MDQRLGIIYKITNKINGKSYIGQTVGSLEKRWKKHCGNSQCILISNAIRKYGKNNFDVKSIGTFTEDNLDKEEIASIKKYNTLSPNGYNLRSGGKNGKMAEETKKKIAKSKIGTHLSKEIKNKISNSLMGKKFSKEHKKKMSESLRGEKHPMFGKRHSQETIEKMRKRTVSEESRKKMSVSRQRYLKNKKADSFLSALSGPLELS